MGSGTLGTVVRSKKNEIKNSRKITNMKYERVGLRENGSES
jgi:hypothetical protein